MFFHLRSFTCFSGLIRALGFFGLVSTPWLLEQRLSAGIKDAGHEGAQRHTLARRRTPWLLLGLLEEAKRDPEPLRSAAHASSPSAWLTREP